MGNSTHHKSDVAFPFPKNSFRTLRKKRWMVFATFFSINFGTNKKIGVPPTSIISVQFSNLFECSIQVAADRAREEGNVYNDGPLQLVSTGHATQFQHKHGHQPKSSPRAPWFRPSSFGKSSCPPHCWLAIVELKKL